MQEAAPAASIYPKPTHKWSWTVGTCTKGLFLALLRLAEMPGDPSCFRLGPPQQDAQGRTHLGFEHLQGQRLHNLPGIQQLAGTALENNWWEWGAVSFRQKAFLLANPDCEDLEGNHVHPNVGQRVHIIKFTAAVTEACSSGMPFSYPSPCPGKQMV